MRAMPGRTAARHRAADRRRLGAQAAAAPLGHPEAPGGGGGSALPGLRDRD
jgi:hypothetical protein